MNSVPNSSLSASSVTVTAGDGLKTGGAVSLGGAVTLNIDPADFAGTGLEDDGSDDLRLSGQGNGIAGGGGTVLSVQAETNGGLQVVAGGVSLASSVAGDSITLNSGVLAVQRSGSNAAAGIEVTSDGIRLNSTINGNKTFGNEKPLPGDLTVNGTNTILNTTELVVEDVLITISSGSSAFATGSGFQIGDGTDALGNMKTATEDFGDGDVNIFKISLPVSSSTVVGGMLMIRWIGK